MELKTIKYEVENHIGWITLNRPEARNAMVDSMRAELVTVLDAAKNNQDERLLVITGAGEKSFCAGADISAFPDYSLLDVMKWKKNAKSPWELVRELSKPCIAMVNGLALGGGCELALACDIIIASENAKFGLPELNVGVIPGGGGTQVLPRLIGEKKAKELIFTGDLITAEEALRLGLINKVVPQNALKTTTLELIAKILNKSPVILKFAKLAVNKSMETPLSMGISIETDYFAMCFSTHDQKEGAKAFLEKRPPQYTGE